MRGREPGEPGKGKFKCPPSSPTSSDVNGGMFAGQPSVDTLLSLNLHCIPGRPAHEDLLGSERAMLIRRP